MNQDQTKKSNQRWLGFVVYCIILTGILLYYKFPSKAFGDYLQNTIGSNYPELSFSMKQVTPSLPIGLKLKQTEMADRETPEKILFRAESLSIKPKILSLFKETREFLFECVTSGGKLKGNILLTENNIKDPWQTTFTLNHIGINEDSSFANVFGRQFEGIINGSGTFRGKGVSLIKGSGEAELFLTDTRISLLKSIMNLEYIEFKEIFLNAKLQNGKLALSDIELKGEKMNGTASGALYLKTDLSASRLDFKGNIEPSAELFKDLTGENNTAAFLNRTLKGGKLPFKISGTIKAPKVRFL